MKMRILWIIMLMAVGYGWAETPPPGLPMRTVKVRLPGKEKKEFQFAYRAPKSYEPEGKQVHRILVNCVWPTKGFDAWADERGIFVFHAVFSNSLCWKVDEGYGLAVLLGLAELKKNYRVATDQLLVYGVSRGGQFSNYFVTWKPEIVTAWVSGIPGILDQPNERMAFAPGLVTAGEADSGRYHMMLQFLSEARKYKLPIIWRSYACRNLPIPYSCQHFQPLLLLHAHRYVSHNTFL